MADDVLRSLPAVGALLENGSFAALVERHGRPLVTRAVRDAVAHVRAEVRAGRPPSGGASLAAEVEREAVVRVGALARGALVPVINATGVVVHTNLGRAPLAREALDAAAAVGAGYATLELDLATGKRGDRNAHVGARLAEITGAEDAIVVNNNAAAVLLVTTALAAGREVIVSRGELVEIGGGFRVPEVIASCGATLVEVGTTNRTHPADYERAIGERTACLLKVHRSNFAVRGFTSEVSIAELAAIAHPRGLPVVHDAGSGVLAELAERARDLGEPTVPLDVRAGADVVTFSGDKLLGGPQAGVVVGRRDLIARFRAHPLFRALRPDKLTLAALAATVDLWRRAPERIPVVRAILAPLAELEARAEVLARAARDVAGEVEVEVDVVPTSARVGGGAAPDRELPSRAVRLATPAADELARALRLGSPAVVARIEGGAVLVDLRAVPPETDADLAEALARALAVVTHEATQQEEPS